MGIARWAHLFDKDELRELEHIVIGNGAHLFDNGESLITLDVLYWAQYDCYYQFLLAKP